MVDFTDPYPGRPSYYLLMRGTLLSQSVAGNYSRCRIQMWAVSGGGGSYNLDNHAWYAYYGVEPARTGSRDLDFRPDSKGKMLPILDVTVNLPHGSNRQRTVTMQGRHGGGLFGVADTGVRSWALPRIPYPAPGTPSLSLVSDAAGEVTGSWAHPGGTVTTYDMQVADDTAFTKNLATASGGSSPRTFTGRTPGATAYARVRARNGDATGSWSAVRSVVVKATKPAAPGGLAATPVYPGEDRITWSAPSSTGGKPITQYELQVSLKGDFTDATTTITTSRQATVTVPPGAAYKVRVRARNADAIGDWSAALAVVSLSAMSVSDGEAWDIAGLLIPGGGAAALYVSNGTEWLAAGTAP